MSATASGLADTMTLFMASSWWLPPLSMLYVITINVRGPTFTAQFSAKLPDIETRTMNVSSAMANPITASDRAWRPFHVKLTCRDELNGYSVAGMAQRCI
jgi:hypothetical protein